MTRHRSLRKQAQQSMGGLNGIMITSKNDRMLELLWFVGYCGEFPSQLASRVGGHPEWNRHVKYRAIKEGLVSVSRDKCRQRIIRSLHLTQAGLDYIGARDPVALSHVLALQGSENTGRPSIEKILRSHSVAISMVMAHNAGAAILPQDKPSLMSPQYYSSSRVAADPKSAYYYSPREIRMAIQEYEPNSVAKTSRITGIIVKGHRCYCLYHTGFTRMFWLRNNEENTVASIDTLLNARDFHCTVYAQVVIGTKMETAKKIGKHRVNSRSRYFTVSDTYNNCFYLENSARGDELLNTILDEEKQMQENRMALMGFNPPAVATRAYDALTPDLQRPVILGYQCDLLALLNVDPAIPGFQQSPIILCYDYQVDAIQTIVGPLIEVRSINGGYYREKETCCDS